ncbi:MAG: hypothetical protein V1837_00780 [Candidatus Woesearchaeota archaeon]
MANQSLVMFIQNSIQNGQDINSVRNQLIAQGYSPYEIDTAINFLYNKPTQIHHTISFSKSAIIAIAAICIGLALTAYLFISLNNTAPSKLLDFQTSPIKSALKAGEKLQFKVTLFNMGSSQRYDVQIKSVVQDNNNREVASKEDTLAVEKRTTETMEIELPAGIEAGKYTVKSTASYTKGTASSSFQFTVYKESATASCFDNKQNQGETGIDCGGLCEKCPSCSDGIMNQDEEGIDCSGVCQACKQGCEDCDDNNQCTIDSCDNGQCVHERIIPCCGDGACDANDCAKDCEITESTSEIIDRAGTLSKTDPNKAKQTCETLRQLSDKDHCFDVIAKTVNQSIACGYINMTANRDACYMHFAMRYDFTVCEKVENPYLQKSCESLKYIKTQE